MKVWTRRPVTRQPSGSSLVAWGRRWAGYIDAMSLRERAMVFCSAAAILLFVYFGTLGNPLANRLRSVAQEVARNQSETKVMQDKANKLIAEGKKDADAVQRARIADLKSRVAAADARLAIRQQALIPPDRIPALLEEILKRDPRLELIELRSLPAAPMFVEKGSVEGVVTDAKNRVHVYRHGVEISVNGTYFDLLRYLSALESQSIRMFWKDVEVTTLDYPRIGLKLTVYTLSLERSWVVV